MEGREEDRVESNDNNVARCTHLGERMTCNGDTIRRRGWRQR